MYELEFFEGLMSSLDTILISLGFYSEEEYIRGCQTTIRQDKYISYTDKRNNNNHLIIEFAILEDGGGFSDDLYIKVTSIKEVF